MFSFHDKFCHTMKQELFFTLRGAAVETFCNAQLMALFKTSICNYRTKAVVEQGTSSDTYRKSA